MKSLLSLQSELDTLQTEWEEVNYSIRQRRIFVSAQQIKVWRKHRAKLSKQIKDLEIIIDLHPDNKTLPQ